MESKSKKDRIILGLSFTGNDKLSFTRQYSVVNGESLH